MKIVFAGGGTGGHFYPIIAVAEKVNEIADKEKIVDTKLYFFSNDSYDKKALFENNLKYEEISAGKLRKYFSVKNFFDLFKTFSGLISSILKLFSIYPDIVFGKGGYASFPVLLAARILRIPVIIHESDSAPGRVNMWAGKFARKVAVSFEEAGKYFNKEKVAWTGQPIRKEILNKAKREDALEYFRLDSKLPVLWILGGSQGAELINNTILDALPRLIKQFQIIHQTGIRNLKAVKDRADVILTNEPNKNSYKAIAFMGPVEMKMAAGVADLIISRAGSSLFEIAVWQVPSILIPITNTNLDHQKKNAFAYARAGGCIVIEEANLTANIVSAECERIIENKELLEYMTKSAGGFSHGSAAEKIAKEIVKIALGHEK